MRWLKEQRQMFLVIIPEPKPGTPDLWAFFKFGEGLERCGFPVRQVQSFADVSPKWPKGSTRREIVLAESDEHDGLFQVFYADAFPATGWTVQPNAVGAFFANWVQYAREIRDDG
jgi:hypothetical protein